MARHAVSTTRSDPTAAECAAFQQQRAARRTHRHTHPAVSDQTPRVDRSGRLKVIADYVEVIELVAPTAVPRVVPGDIDDDQVIAAAVAAQADLIVSGDRKHLLPLGSHAGIAIIDAAEALRRMEVIRA